MKSLRPHQKEALEAIQTNKEGIVHLPTGTGKTMIEALTIFNNISNATSWLNTQNRNDDVPVFAILAPRIILVNQLFKEIKQLFVDNKKDCQYLIVHSGHHSSEYTKEMKLADLPFRQLLSTTSSIKIKEEYDKARAERVPLVIFSTYDSSERILQSKIPVYMLLCDEAQYLVSERFNWIACDENENPEENYFTAERKYYFTATLKETASDHSLGMNNSNVFGPIIYKKTPAEMIVAGEMIRPRLHLVDTRYDQGNEIDKDVNAIISAFIEQKSLCKVSSKMLIITKGTQHLNDILRHPRILNLIETRPSLKIFDISSANGARINNKYVTREVFLETFKDLKDNDEALIFHIDILSEGIDVPGITSILPMNAMGLGKFLQNLGRASRLHERDREKLYNGIIKYNELEKFTKDYAWVIIPTYGVIGENLKVEFRNIIYALRNYGFNASEDVYIKQLKPVPPGDPKIEKQNEIGHIKQKLFDIIIEMVHEIEEQEEADKLILEEFRMTEKVKLMNEEELIKF